MCGKKQLDSDGQSEQHHPRRRYDKPRADDRGHAARYSGDATLVSARNRSADNEPYGPLTRDGTYLIENGRISKSIKNMRFNESPLFLRNNVDALGPVRRTASEGPGTQIMPILKAHDFNFTSLSDAV